MQTILIVEDEAGMRAGLEDVLRMEGYEVLVAETGTEGYALAIAHRPALVLLDVMLPELSGVDVLRRLRGEGFNGPIIMLTARGTELDKVRGFSSGVDDYVTKPFSVLELLGRIQAVLRRMGGNEQVMQAVTLGGLQVDFEQLIATRDGDPLPLGPKPIAVLRTLFRRRGQIVTRDQLVDEVWGQDEFINTRTIDNHIVQLRAVLGSTAIRTVHGHGYRLEI